MAIAVFLPEIDECQDLLIQKNVKPDSDSVKPAGSVTNVNVIQKLRNVFKLTLKGTRTASMATFWCVYC